MSKSKKTLLPQIFEPLAVVAVLGLFAIPVLTVINLSPITQSNKSVNVLGATSSPNSINIELLDEDEEVFSAGQVMREGDSKWVYMVDVFAREKEKEYSKEVFRIRNRSNTRQTVVVSGYTNSTSSTSFSLKMDNEWYVLRDGSREMYEREIILEPNAVKTIELSTYSESNILFKETFTIDIVVK